MNFYFNKMFENSILGPLKPILDLILYIAFLWKAKDMLTR